MNPLCGDWFGRSWPYENYTSLDLYSQGIIAIKSGMQAALSNDFELRAAFGASAPIDIYAHPLR